MFDELAGGVDIALEAGPPRLAVPQPGIFSGLFGAVPRGIAAGLLDVAAVASWRSSPISPPGTERHALQQRMRDEAEASAKSIRGFTTKHILPKPEETGAASQILFGVSRLLSKAVPLTIAGGPVAGAVGTGAIEGAVEAAGLQDAGVDPATAKLAGVAKAVTTGAQVALPLAGATKLGTAGLVAAGGPGGFMADQATIKWVLENADYKEIARRYDPFDPVGLMVSTLFAGGFGVASHAMRARGVTPEVEAAARARQVADLVEETSLGAPKEPAAQITHLEALEAAAKAMDAGEPVNVRLVGLDEVRVREAAAKFLEVEIAAQAGRGAAMDTPGFLRTAEDLIALRESQGGQLPAAVQAALEIAKKPGFLRTAEERIKLDGLLAQKYQITDGPVVARPEPAKTAESVQIEAVPAAKVEGAQQADPLVADARAVAVREVDLMVPNEAGELVPAAKLLDDAEAQFKDHEREAGAYQAAVLCFLRG